MAGARRVSGGQCTLAPALQRPFRVYACSAGSHTCTPLATHLEAVQLSRHLVGEHGPNQQPPTPNHIKHTQRGATTPPAVAHSPPTQHIHTRTPTWKLYSCPAISLVIMASKA